MMSMEDANRWPSPSRAMNRESEEENYAWLMLIRRNVPDPAVANLIFHSKEDLTAEEVIERAFAYRPIILGPAKEDY